MTGTTFPTSEIIGKTLIAKEPVPIYNPSGVWGETQPLRIIPAGGTVGVVFSYIDGAPELPFFWIFNAANGTSYVAEHKIGAFSVESLQQQGAQTTEELTEEEGSFFDMFSGDNVATLGKGALALGAAALLAVIVLKKL
jgi:hypothetical protein